MTKLAEAYVEIRANPAPLQAGMATAVGSVKAGTSVMKAQLASLAAYLGPISAAFAAAFVFKKIIGNAMEFEHAMTESLAIVTDSTVAQRKAMEKTAVSVTRYTTVSAKNAAKSYFYLASAGLAVEEQMGALPIVAKFAQAGAFDMALATDLLTDAQSALGMATGTTAQKLENMQAVADAFATGNILANASMQQFSEAMVNMGGAALKGANKGLKEGTVILAAFADQGVKGNVAGQKMYMILRDMQTAALKNGKAFETAGIDVYNKTTGELHHMADIMEQVEAHFGSMSPKARKSGLAMLGFTDKSQGAMLQLMGTSAKMKLHAAALEDMGGTTDRIAKKQLGSLTNQLKLLMNAFNEMGLVIGSQAMAPLAGMAKAVRFTIYGIIALNDATGGLLVNMVKVAATVLMAAKVLPLLAKGLMFAAGAVVKFAMANKMLLAQYAIVLAAYQIWQKYGDQIIAAVKSSETFKNVVVPAFQAMKKAVNEFAKVVTTKLQAFLKAMGMGAFRAEEFVVEAKHLALAAAALWVSFNLAQVGLLKLTLAAGGATVNLLRTVASTIALRVQMILSAAASMAYAAAVATLTSVVAALRGVVTMSVVAFKALAVAKWAGRAATVALNAAIMAGTAVSYASIAAFNLSRVALVALSAATFAQISVARAQALATSGLNAVLLTGTKVVNLLKLATYANAKAYIFSTAATIKNAVATKMAAAVAALMALKTAIVTKATLIWTAVVGLSKKMQFSWTAAMLAGSIIMEVIRMRVVANIAAAYAWVTAQNLAKVATMAWTAAQAVLKAVMTAGIVVTMATVVATKALITVKNLAKVATLAQSAALGLAKAAMLGFKAMTVLATIATVGFTVAVKALRVSTVLMNAAFVLGAGAMKAFKVVTVGTQIAMQGLTLAINFAKLAVKSFFRATLILGVIAAVIEGGIFLWKKYGDTIMSIWNDPAEGAGMLKNAVTAVQNAYQWLKDAAVAAFTEMQPYILAAWDYLQQIGAWLASTGVQMWEAYKAYAVKVWESIKAIALAVWEPIKAAALAFYDWIVGAIQRNQEEWAQWTDYIVEIWQNMMDILGQGWDMVVAGVEWAVDSIVALWSVLSDAMLAVFDGVLAFFGTNMDEMVDMGFGFVTELLDVFSLLTTDIGLTWELMKTTLALALVKMLDKTIMIFNTIKATVMGTGAALGAIFLTVCNNIWHQFEKMAAKVTGTFKGLWAGIKALFKGDSFGDAFDEAYSQEVGKVKSKNKEIGEEAGKAFNKTFVKNMGDDSPMKDTIDVLEGDQARQLTAMEKARDAKRKKREDAKKDAKEEKKEVEKPEKPSFKKPKKPKRPERPEKEKKDEEEEEEEDDKTPAPKEEEGKSSFVGIAEMSRKIQSSLTMEKDNAAEKAANEAEKQNKKMDESNKEQKTQGETMNKIEENTAKGGAATFQGGES